MLRSPMSETSQKMRKLLKRGQNSMCNASGISYKRIHALGVPILTHQETVNGHSDRCDQYFQQLQELGTGTQHFNILSIVS
jgi:hypothetical protein